MNVAKHRLGKMQNRNQCLKGCEGAPPYLEYIVGAQHLGVCLHIKGLHEFQCDQKAIFYLDTVAAGAEWGIRCWIVRAGNFSSSLSKNLVLTLG